MKDRDESGKEHSKLRKRAEALLSERLPHGEEVSALPPVDAEKLIYELRVHQIELELQNEELRKVQKRFSESRERLSDLYDHAPAGYFTLSENGLILEVNFSGAALLATAKSSLLGRQFQCFLNDEGVDIFSRHTRSVFTTRIKQQCELELLRADGNSFFAQLESLAEEVIDGKGSQCLTIVFDITERRQREEKLRLSEEKYRSLVETTSDCIWELDSQGRYNYLSPGFQDQTGYPPEAFLGRTPVDLLPEDGSLHDREQFLSIVAARQSFASVEHHFRHRDGRMVIVEVSGVPLFSASGDYRGMRGIGRDITERKRVEEALQKAEHQLKLILDTVPALIWQKDREGKYLQVNKACCDTVGIPVQCILGKTDHDLFPAEIADRYFTDDRKVLQSGKPELGVEEQHQKFSGELGWSRTDKMLHYDVDGAIAGTIGFAVDISEFKRAEKKLLAASQYARSLIEASLDPLVTISPEGKITDVNHATEEATGVAREHLIGEDFSNYFTEPEKARAGYQKVLEDGWVRDYPLTIRHRSGKITEVLYNATVYTNEAGERQGVFAAARDITEQTRMEQELRASEEKFRAVFDNALEGVFLTEAGGTIHTANKRACELVGYSEEEFCAGGRDIVVDPDDHRFELAQKELLRTGRFIGELSFRKKDGTVSPAMVSASQFELATGDLRMSVFFRDITEQKLSEKLLREAEEQYRTLVESSPVAIFVEIQERFSYLNPAAVKLFGVTSAEQLVGTPIIERLHPDSNAEVHRHMPQVDEEKQGVASLEAKYLRSDGTEVDVEVSTVPFRYRHQDGALVFVRDITHRKLIENQLRESHLRLESRVQERTAELAIKNAALEAEIAERRQAEEALRKSEERFRELAENIREVFWVRTSHELLYVSPAYEEIWGRKRESLLEAPGVLMETVYPEDRGTFVEAQNVDLTGVASLDHEFRIIRPDGAVRWIGARSFPVLEEGRLVRIVGIAEDITARKEAETVLRIERDLAMQLASAVNPADALEFLLDGCLKIGGFDCGGIYTVERETGALRLVCHRGLSADFVEQLLFFDPTSFLGRFATQGQPAYWNNPGEMLEIGSLFMKEGIEAVAYIPVKSQGEAVALLNVSSHSCGDISFLIRNSLEILAARIGGIVARFRLAETIKVQSEHLEETNAALRVLLKQRELDRSELEESLMSNVKNLVLPYLDKLKKSRLGEEQKHLFEILEGHLREITSPFVRKLSAPMLKLTPTEIRVAELIRQGLSTKEIADLLTTSDSAVIFHRQGVRRKLGLVGKGINLQAYLTTLI